MKNLFFIYTLALMCACVSSLSASERGKFIHIDGTINKNLKPQLAFQQEVKDGQDVTTLLVQTVNPNAYNEFNEASRVLLRFADGKAVRLNRIAESIVKKDKNTEKKGNATITFYRTTTTYEVQPEVIEKLAANIAIIKVRIVFKENDAKDYEIAEGYQTKMASDLYKSFLEAQQKNKVANGDLSDDDF